LGTEKQKGLQNLAEEKAVNDEALANLTAPRVSA
jgi:hypothetical protein